MARVATMAASLSGFDPMRFLTKFAIAIVGWNFLPPADAPAATRIVPPDLTFQTTSTALCDGDGLDVLCGGAEGSGRSGSDVSGKRAKEGADDSRRV